jgi:hypothetical protein
MRLEYCAEVFGRIGRGPVGSSTGVADSSGTKASCGLYGSVQVKPVAGQNFCELFQSFEKRQCAAAVLGCSSYS